MKAPDFPTGGIIYGYEGVKEAYTTGRGRIVVRAKASIETGKNDRQSIVITEIPYQVNKANLIEKIADLVNDKKLEDISDIRDESDRDGMRIVIELKRDANAEVILNNLYKHTQMQTTFGVIMLALVDGRPQVLTLKEMMQHFIEHRNEVVVRRSKYRAGRGGEARAHSRRLHHRARQHRRDHQADQGVEGCRDREDRPDEEVQALRDPGEGDPGHAAAAAHRPGTEEDRG